ncbi:MAG TPA: 2-nitropropane dioxygenase [Elusimicrobia bacterium]|nr:2-nitropropane dioxygenase [Elusimicrobiota bacterium]
MQEALRTIREPLYALDLDGAVALAIGGNAQMGADAGRTSGALPVLAWAPAIDLARLGDPSFCADHHIRYPYVAGSMANGISSVELVEAMARAGCLGFFGAAGLETDKIAAAIDRLIRSLGTLPFGVNLIHNPAEPDMEAAAVDLFLRKDIRLVEAAAYLNLTLPLVRYRVHGIHRDAAGEVVAPNRIIAKVSRVEVATRFLSPPPANLLRALVASGELSEAGAAMAAEIPMAEDLTAEADSAGHTDNRSLVDLFPTLASLRDRMTETHRYRRPPRVGAAGGISSPLSAAAAFSMGAAYLVVGSVHQSCAESGTSPVVRELLAAAGQADTAMAPAADMFEMGVRVQVLKRGTMFAMRAAKLYDAYRAYDSIEALPGPERERLEAEIFQAPLEDVWRQTREFFLRRDPEQVHRAEADPHHRMALVFRWYLGLASRWANAGDPGRRMDYQIWCGPAMGAFNEWVRGTFLSELGSRRAAAVALNLVFGAAVQLRLNTLRAQGAALPAGAARVRPLEIERIEEQLR